MKVKVLQSGDAGAALNQVILTKSNPIGDVFFGVDNTFLSRALDADVFAKYASGALCAACPTSTSSTRRTGSRRSTTATCASTTTSSGSRSRSSRCRRRSTTSPSPRTRACSWSRTRRRRRPGSRSSSRPSREYGDDGWRDYWSKLRANDVKVDDGWESAYDGDFTQGANQGTYPLVVSYASSPPAAVYYSKPQPKTSPIGTMLDSCFRQVEFAGVLKGTEHPAAARKLVDFMLSARFQADIPLQMFVFPVRDGTPLPPVFTKFAEVPAKPLSLPAGRHRRAPRRVDRAVDRHRAAVTRRPRRRASGARRWRSCRSRSSRCSSPTR